MLRREIKSWEEKSGLFPESDGPLEAEEEARKLLPDARNPTGIPNFHTRGEIEVLRLFKESQHDCAPWLLNVKQDILECGAHSCEMVSGYIVHILITKLPGKRLYRHFWALPREARDEIREASSMP